MPILDLSKVHPSWRTTIEKAMAAMDQRYLQDLNNQSDWLPGHSNIFNAFSLDLNKVNYVLLGESPYPRTQSANGYAFWDANVKQIWSNTGLSKEINRATSLRNLIKMLLLANGSLTESDTNQEGIAKIDKSHLVQDLTQLFGNLQQHGFLLLNASLVLSDKKVSIDAKAWQVFLEKILLELKQKKPDTKLILLGKIAEKINAMPVANHFDKLIAEHPYNISFIQNTDILNFFRPFNLLQKATIAEPS